MNDKWLYIAQYFPPGSTVAARRFTQLMRNRKGVSFAIRRNQPGDGWPAPSHVGVHTISSIDLRSLMTTDAAQATMFAKKTSGLARLLTLRQAYPFLYLTDDGGPQYRRKAYAKACELVEKHGITTVFSSFRPWSDHLVAARVKKRFPEVRWIADFRDLPVDVVRQDVWWPALQTWWGKRVVATADELWVVSEGQKEQLSDWHPRIKVVRNALLRLPLKSPPPSTRKFTIVYTGSLYAGLQSMKPLVNAIRALLADGTMQPEKTLLMYRGKDGWIFKQQTEKLPAEILDIQPSIAPASAQKMQQNAQVLLLLNWSAPAYYGVLTAKLWDYLGSGRPILALVNGPMDPELQHIIEGADAGAVFAEKQQGEVTDWLRRAYATWQKGGQLPWPVDHGHLSQYLP